MTEPTTRERAVMLADAAWKTSGEGSAHGRIVDAIERAIREEREACAWIAENACLVPPDGGCPSEDEQLVAERAAKAIRARA